MPLQPGVPLASLHPDPPDPACSVPSPHSGAGLAFGSAPGSARLSPGQPLRQPLGICAGGLDRPGSPAGRINSGVAGVRFRPFRRHFAFSIYHFTAFAASSSLSSRHWLFAVFRSAAAAGRLPAPFASSIPLSAASAFRFPFWRWKTPPADASQVRINFALFRQHPFTGSIAQPFGRRHCCATIHNSSPAFFIPG